nr:uncharacterized protein LOC118681685 [Bactrocera oleae]
MRKEEDPEDNIPLSILKTKWDAEINSLMETSDILLHNLSPQVEFSLPMVEKWNDDPCVDDSTDIQEMEVSEDRDDIYIFFTNNKSFSLSSV